MYRFLALFSIFLFMLCSCKKSSQNYGYVRFVFEHQWNDSIVKIDGTTEYTNKAGNILTFENLEYFISDLSINGASMEVFMPDAHYIRDDQGNSIKLMTHQVPTGNYQSIRFTFGLDQDKNRSNRFSESPKKDMFWPENMGGGYHFLKLDGKWKNPEDAANQGFGLHLGTLKKDFYDTIWTKSVVTQQDSIARIDTIVRWFTNHFPVLIAKNFDVKTDEITTIKIIMDLKQWMETPYTWDFNTMGGAIMSNENALDSLKANGGNVFK